MTIHTDAREFLAELRGDDTLEAYLNRVWDLRDHGEPAPKPQGTWPLWRSEWGKPESVVRIEKMRRKG